MFVSKFGVSGSTTSQLQNPAGVAVDASGNLWVADTQNNRLSKFDSSGTQLLTVTGLSSPQSVAVSSAGVVFVSDKGNDRVVAYNGSGVQVSSWSGGLNDPSGIAVGPSLDVYVADQLNHRVVAFSSAGVFVSSWGAFGSSTGTFFLPSGIAVDTSENVYVADLLNRVQVFTSTGGFTQCWGTGAPPCDGGQSFNNPQGLSYAGGRIFVADTNNNRVRILDTSGGVIESFGDTGSFGDNGRLTGPLGVAATASDVVWVADTETDRIQKFASFGPATTPISVDVSSLTARWTSSLSTTFAAQVSTSAAFTNAISSLTAAFEATFVGLSTNTVYHARVSTDAVNWTTLGSKATLAVTPGTPSWTVVGSTTATAAWTAGDNTAGTAYTVQASTASDFTGTIVSSRTLALSATLSPLVTDSTYYLRVSAENQEAVATSAAVGASTLTSVSLPTALAPTDVSSNTVRANWSANGNGASTTYEVETSTDPAFSVFTASQTLATNALFSDLLSNTTQHFRVRARNSAGTPTADVTLSSVSTLAAAPATLAQSFTGVFASSVTAAWAATPGAGYRLEASTDAFSTVVTSATADSAVSTLTVTGLTANTTYAFRVGSLNAAGSANYTSLGSTVTLAIAPSTGPTTVTSSSATASWSGASNPSGTTYEVQLALDAAFTSPSSSTTTSVSLTFDGLASNTTHHLRVRAVGGDGTPTAYATLPVGVTLALAPSGPALGSVSSTTAQLSWSANGNAGDIRYRAEISTAADYSVIEQSSVTLAASVDWTGLTPNRFYRFRVVSLNRVDAASASVETTTRTLAASPLSPAATAANAGQTVLSWSSNNNPSGTPYTAQLSTEAAFSTVQASSVTFGTTATFSSLTPNTTWHLRVRAANADGLATAFTSGVSTVTAASVPAAGAGPTVGTGTIVARWTANANPSDTSFEAELSTASDFSVKQATSTLGTLASFDGLSALTTYHLRVRAVSRLGAPTDYLSLGSTRTLSAALSALPYASVGTRFVEPAWSDAANPAGNVYTLDLSLSGAFGTIVASTATIGFRARFGEGGASPNLTPNTTYFARVKLAESLTTLGSTVTLAVVPANPAFSAVFASSLTVSWSSGTSGSGFNPSGTSYELQFSTDSSFAGAGTTQLTGFSQPFTGLSDRTTYYARVRAVNRLGVETAYAATVSTVTPAPATLESQVVGPDSPETAVELTGTGGDIDVVLPPGAFAEPVLLTAKVPLLASLPPPTAPSASLRATGIGLELSTIPERQPVRAVRLTFAYRPQDLADSPPERLVVARYDEDTGAWALLPTTLDATAGTVSAETGHFSTFSVLVLTPAAAVGTAAAYPNPFRPNRGHVEMKISNIPAAAAVKLYTPLGELIRELTADGAGQAHWDGQTASGQNAASGLYIAVIESGGDRKLLKVAVQR